MLFIGIVSGSVLDIIYMFIVMLDIENIADIVIKNINNTT